MTDLVAVAGQVFAVVASLGGWVLYFRERDRSRDYVTDLVQLIHDYDLDRSDLRRSLGHEEVEAYLERWDDGE